MTGRPSELGELLVEDICDCVPRLNCKCCARQVWGMFREALPVVIRNHIAQLTFSKDNYLQIFTICDQIYDSNRDSEPAGQVAAVITNQPQPSTPEVAATTTSARGRGNRGRGNRGNRGGGQNQGQGRGSNSNSTQNQTTPAEGHKGPKHATAKGSNDKLCKIHYRWGENGSYCAAPWKCPMKDIYKAPQ